jgi:hypothetical protein
MLRNNEKLNNVTVIIRKDKVHCRVIKTFTTRILDSLFLMLKNYKYWYKVVPYTQGVHFEN